MNALRITACSVVMLLIAWMPAATNAQRSASSPVKSPALWLAPATPPGNPAFGAAVQALADDHADVALPVFTREISNPVLGNYARLYTGRAQLILKAIPDAQASVAALLKADPQGVLRENALLLAVDVAMAANDPASAILDLQDLQTRKPRQPERVWLALGRAAEKANDHALALSSLRHVYYDYATSPEADDAAKDLATLTGSRVAPSSETASLDLSRAEQLYAARRFTDARPVFEALHAIATGDDRDLVTLRIAECDVNLKKYQPAIEPLTSFFDKPVHQDEAKYWYLVALRGLNKEDDYVAAVQSFVDEHPASSWADEALNDLGTHFTVANDDGKAATVFTQEYRLFPKSGHAERAAWKAGWWAYKNANYAETVRLFEDASTEIPHADTRPAWLYWAARAHAKLNDQAAAIAGYRRTVSVYCNTYYGREAQRALDALAARHVTIAPVPHVLTPLTPGDPPANASFITALLSAGLYDDAIAEVRDDERRTGSTPLLDATLAYAYQGKSDLRTGYSLMKRAYPQYLAVGGELLPMAIQKVIYPIAYWDVIYKDAIARKLDPFVMAALINTESTFQADAKSGANAWGLMQVVPGTGREYALKLGIKPFSTARLVEPDVNTRIGMAYFADLMKQFDNKLPAVLASYNAGENRAARWIAERPGLDRDEFIDDIPFPETQGYVKRIIGLAEDYRRVYKSPIVASPSSSR